MKAIFYASSTGNTEEVAGKINEKLDGFELIDIANDGVDKMNECESIIVGVSTWGEGDLQDDWEDCLADVQAIDFSNKTVALFGLGDQDGYPDEFVDALGIMHEEISSKGANIIGHTSTDGYEYDESKAEVDGNFIGLVIDEDNQSELTDERIDNWCTTIKNQI
ncbi:flavodoxin [Arcobacter sp. LA11]|uniref:flavodoxin n=1 Tax=Arcobacter sp. LA11 TaxID=1898176 RepID=UPI000934C598|nr:flavodoxin [Arcobacter sp. LA11]